MATARRKNGSDAVSQHIEHMELYAGLKTEIAVLATKLDEKHLQNTEKLNSTFSLIMEKLKPLDEIAKTVALHSKQITFWKGSQAVVVFMVGAVLSFFGIHRR